MTTASASGAPRITSTGSPRSEPRSEVLEIPRTKRRRPTLNAFSAIEVLVPYTWTSSVAALLSVRDPRPEARVMGAGSLGKGSPVRWGVGRVRQERRLRVAHRESVGGIQ